MPPASLFPNRAIALLVASSRSQKQTILPKVFTEFRIRFVLENACIRPCIFRFLSTQSVFNVVASKPVRNILTTISKSISRFFTVFINRHFQKIAGALVKIPGVKTFIIQNTICGIRLVRGKREDSGDGQVTMLFCYLFL